MHGFLGLLMIIGFVAWVFGERAAKAMVATGLIMAAILLLYIFARIVTGTI